MNTPTEHRCEARTECAYWARTEYELDGERKWICDTCNRLAILDGWKPIPESKDNGQ